MTHPTNPSAVPDLLAELGLTDKAQLWELSMGLDTDPAGQATARLAADAAGALERLEDAERHAGQHLARIGELQGGETLALAEGLTGNAMWLVQAAGKYADALAAFQSALNAYRAAAGPLKLLADLHPGKGTAATITAEKN